MSYTTVLDYTPGSDTTAGGAGTTTGLGSNLADVRGGVWSRSGGKVVNNPSGVPLYGGLAARTGDGYTEQKVEVLFTPVASTPAEVIVALRADPVAGKYYYVSALPHSPFFGGGAMQIAAVTNGNASPAASPTTTYPGSAMVDGRQYKLSVVASGTSPTVVTGQIIDTTDDSVFNTITLSDSTAGLQQAGSWGLICGTVASPVDHLTLSQNDTVTPAPGTAGFVSTDGTTIHVLGTAPAGVTSPAYQWYASRTAGFADTDSGVVTGPTTLAWTHTTGTASGTAWYYRLKVTAGGSDYSPVKFGVTQGWAPECVGLLGDSITERAFSADDFRNTLAAIAPGRTYTVNNQGVSGTDTAYWLPSANHIQAAVAAMKTAGATKVGVMLGDNDAHESVPVSTYSTNMAAILAYVVSQGLTPAVHSPPACVPGSLSNNYTDVALGLLHDYGVALDALCNGTTILRGDRTLWTYSAEHPDTFLIGSWAYGGDGVHPTQAGQTVMQQRWAYGFASAFGLTAGAPSGGQSGTVPSASDVRYGVAVGSGTGTCHVPAAAQVLAGVAVDATTGTVTLPTASQVQSGVTFGAGSATTGTYAGTGSGLNSTQVQAACAAAIAATPVTLNLAQALPDAKSATVGGALAGGWTTAWGRASKDLVTRVLNLWGPGNATDTPSAVFSVDSALAPTERTPV